MIHVLKYYLILRHAPIETGVPESKIEKQACARHGRFNVCPCKRPNHMISIPPTVYKPHSPTSFLPSFSTLTYIPDIYFQKCTCSTECLCLFCPLQKFQLRRYMFSVGYVGLKIQRPFRDVLGLFSSLQKTLSAIYVCFCLSAPLQIPGELRDVLLFCAFSKDSWRQTHVLCPLVLDLPAIYKPGLPPSSFFLQSSHISQISLDSLLSK
jgi:hypothetical protein